MSIHVCKCIRKEREEYHLRYPGMTESEAQELADKINAGGLSSARIDSARPINCDQVSWMLSAIGRYLPPSNHPAVSRAREMQKYALLYEIMKVAHLHFMDDAAQHNGTPPDVRRFRYASKQDECQINRNSAGGSLQAARQAIQES